MKKTIKAILISERSEETRFCRAKRGMVLILSIAVFVAGILLAPSVFANNNLVVQFEPNPLFTGTNFLPGQNATGTARVTNNSGQTQRIATEAINKNDPDNFASQLNLNIKEGLTVIFNNTLAQFFSQGETYLSSLANGVQTQYDFTITFNSGAGNDYQEKSLGFDILVGFEGTEGGVILPPPGGGGGGGGGGVILPPGLTIEYEKFICVSAQDAVIHWLTSYKSTSRVVYGTATGTFALYNAPNYGYASSTDEKDNAAPISANGVTSHTVNITGLASGTTYYFRAVSHASPPTISQERSFTTLMPGEKSPCCGTEEEKGAPTTPATPELTGGAGGEIAFEPSLPLAPSGEAAPPEESQEPVGEPVIDEVSGGDAETPDVAREGKSLLSKGVASIGGFLSELLGNIADILTARIGCFSWWLIALLCVLSAMRIIILWRKKRGETDLLRKKYLTQLGNMWTAYLGVALILLIWILSAGAVCPPFWVSFILFFVTLLFLLFDRRIIRKVFPA